MNNNRTRTISIIIAVILGLATLLYLGGLVCQLLTKYQVWLASGGMQGQAQIGDIRFGPLSCWCQALTLSGLKYTGLVALIGGSVYAFVRLYDRFGSRDFDDRNFSRSQRGTYGTAGWMAETELRTVLEVASPQKARGIILGQTDRGSVICLPEDTRLNKHIAVFGASGTMKSRGVIRPALFQSIRRGESVVVTDPKSEIYSDTVELFRKYGYTVRVYNLLQPELSDSWNCMFDLGGDTLMAQVLTDVIIANTKGDGKGDHFWDNGEANLLKSLILYVDLDSTRRPEERNLPAVYQMLTQNTEKQLTALFDRLSLDHPARAPYSLFSQASDSVRAGVVLGLGTRLQVLQSEAVRSITRQSGIDLALPGQTKCAYYIILDDQNSSLEFLSSLFFAFLFIKLVRYADSTPEQRCPVPVNIVLDEMNNIGVIPDFSRRLSTIRSRSLQVLMCCQNLPQIQNRYPNNLWAELVGNADTQLMLGCTDDVTAEYFSVRSGDMTVEVNSTMTTRQSIAIAQIIPQYRYTQGLGRRRLLTPDEVLRLPNDQLLIIIRGQKILRAKKFDYTGHPYAKECVKTSIRDYPQLQCTPAVDPEPAPEAPETIPAPAPEEPVPPAEPEAAPAVAPAETPKRARRRPTLYESAKPPSDFRQPYTILSTKRRKQIMARTKKELKDQDPLLGSETADQTAGAGADGTGLVPGGEPGAPTPSDLELADGTPLDPDAPQTETGQEPEGGQPPQADLEPGAEPPGLGEPTAVPQTGLEPAGDGTLEPGGAPEFPQTDLELLKGAEGRADEKAGSQTGSEVPDDEAAGESGPAASQTDSGQPKSRLRMPGRRGQRVVSIDAERTVETDTDKLRNDLLDLVESLKGKKILTGAIQGVERLADNPEMSYAVTYHGDYKVIIPVLEAVEEPEDYRGQPKGDVLHYLLNKRLGAEVDYIIKGIDQESGIVAASRLEAMAMKRKEYYFRTDRDGNYQIYAGICAEARVVSVIRAGIFVDLFGAECYIPLRELSYQRWVDATAHYQSGQRVLVRVLEVDRDHRSQLRVSASVKQAGENPYEKALKKYAVGSLYVGTVSMVDTTGVFVSLDGGIDCLCTYPKRGRPPRGCRVSVRILGINYESNRIWGVITHMSTVR